MDQALRERIADTFRFVERKHCRADRSAKQLITEGLPGLSQHLTALQQQCESAPVPSRSAFSLFQQAAEIGFAPSAGELAIHYQFGDVVASDAQQARAWYEKAIELGYLESLPDYALFLSAAEASKEIRARLLALAITGVEFRIPRCHDLVIALSPPGSLSPREMEELSLRGLCFGNAASILDLANLVRPEPGNLEKGSDLADALAGLFSFAVRG